jgi:radical SAM superfamily enzyme YgiQ (UPF0313 family)
MLASILRSDGVRVHEVYFKDWITNRIHPPREQELVLLIATLREIGPDLIGMSVRASAFHRIAAEIAERIRRELDVPILWGGMHATSCPEDAARVADIVCIGEAEDTLRNLVARLREGRDISDLAGLWVHTARGLVRNPPAELVKDLDRLPFPDFHSDQKTFIEGRQVRKGDPYCDQPIYLIMGSRGCPFPSCAFCSNSVLNNVYPGQALHRQRSVDNVLKEVAYAKEHFPNLTRIRFDDEEFPVNSKWFDEFCERWPREAALPFEIHMDPRAVTLERLQRLKAVGLDMVFMGIQSTETINRTLYKRDVSDEQVLRGADAIHASGVRAGYQVILDDPVSQPADKRRLFELLLKIPRPYEMILFSLTVYPGSALGKDLKQRGLIGDQDIEGQATKVFTQFRVDLSYPRGRNDRFWTALVVLVSKDFIPKRLLRWIAASRLLAKWPTPVTVFAFTANMVKLGLMALQLVIRGELSWAIVRRWLSLKSLVTY